MSRSLSQIRNWVFNNLVIFENYVYEKKADDSYIKVEGLLGGLGSIAATPFKVGAAAVKSPFKIAKGAVKSATTAAGTGLKTVGNLASLQPKKAVKSLVGGTADTLKQGTKTARAAISPFTSVGKSVKDIGQSLQN